VQWASCNMLTFTVAVSSTPTLGPVTLTFTNPDLHAKVKQIAGSYEYANHSLRQCAFVRSTHLQRE